MEIFFLYLETWPQESVRKLGVGELAAQTFFSGSDTILLKIKNKKSYIHNA